MKLALEKVNYKYKDLQPVMSEDTLKYHRDNLAKAYVSRFNEGKGDLDFNEAGAFLHNLFFPQLKKPSGRNKPYGASLMLIEDKFETFDNFKEEFSSVAMSIQGSGWVYLSNKGEIKTIRNHQIKGDITLLVDWWEHAWALDYQSDKRKYLSNIWKIIDWSVINDRLNIGSKRARENKLKYFHKVASKKEGLPVFSRPFRRWLRETIYSSRIGTDKTLESRIRLSNWYFKNESPEAKMDLYNAWKALEESKLYAKKERPVEPEVSFLEREEVPDALPEQLSLFSELNSSIFKKAVLKKKKRMTRGGGKKPRMEWGLFSKKDPKKVLKWFGPKKPSKEAVKKEEARIHAFSG